MNALPNFKLQIPGPCIVLVVGVCMASYCVAGASAGCCAVCTFGLLGDR